jgi:hypothetical protein
MNSIDFRLKGRRKFVVRRRNSVDLASNEFAAQVTEILAILPSQRGRLAKNVIFVVFEVGVVGAGAPMPVSATAPRPDQVGPQPPLGADRASTICALSAFLVPSQASQMSSLDVDLNADWRCSGQRDRDDPDTRARIEDDWRIRSTKTGDER